MGEEPTPGARVAPPPIPSPGLERIRAVWSGRGQLLDALAAVQPEHAWSVRDVRRRMHRVLLDTVQDDLAVLPDSVRRWDDVLPAASVVLRTRSRRPKGRIDYVRTRREGWPPERFVVRIRERIPDQLPAEVTAWTLGRLQMIVDDAEQCGSAVPEKLARQLGAARRARGLPALSMADDVVPDGEDLADLRRSGHPWRAIAALATSFKSAEDDPASLAYRLILPDPELAERLFHLAVVGEVLRGADAAGRNLVSRRPLGSSGKGAQFWTSDGNLRLWMEAAGIWSSSPVPPPFRQAMIGLPGAGGQALRADLLLSDQRRALILECKYSRNPSYVAQGYAQVIAYGAELRRGIFDEVTTVVVAPDGVVERQGRAETLVGITLVVPASNVPDIVSEWVASVGR